MPKQPIVQVLLATYNGAAFIASQLDSLFAQSMSDFEILVADDGSRDETPALLREACASNPGRMRIVHLDRVGGPVPNFMRLLAASNAPYVMFCDQDDIWLPDKIRTLLEAVRSLEAGETQTPALIHSDLRVVDAELRPIARSFFELHALDPTLLDLRGLLVGNRVVGCATMFNRALAQLASGNPTADIVMHDWWIAILGSAFGRVAYLDEAMTLYRQHGNNVVGANPKSRSPWRHFRARLVEVAKGGGFNRSLRRSFSQAAALLEIHGTALSPASRNEVASIAAMARQGALRRRYTAYRSGLLEQGLLRNLATLFVL
jgi:glycosyltransferase involved in cell wall biosynthesis